MGRVYFSHAQSKKGTAILMHKNIPFCLEHKENDSEERMILIKGLIYGQHITILNMYALNNESAQFMLQILDV